MSVKKDIIDWNISVTWDNGEKENITTIPQNLTDAVHELTESLEVDLAEKRIEKYSLNKGEE